MPDFDQILSIIKTVTQHDVIVDENCTPKGVRVAPQDLVKVCATLLQHPETYFDMLSCITGIDNGVQAATMEVVYTLYSIPYNSHLTVKVMIPREAPVVDTISHLWKTANWHERETFDLLGISFTGHPDLRRILLPADWEGHPLRKDYKQQEYYRNIKVEY